MKDADSQSAGLLRLRIHNAAGRRTAHEVEVFISVTTMVDADPTALRMVLEEDSNLNFAEPKGERPGKSSVSVPAGYSRLLPFMIVGRHAYIGERFGISVPILSNEPSSWIAIPVMYPASDNAQSVLQIGYTYDITLVVTGSNFDAVTFRGQFELQTGQEIQGRRTVRYGWLRQPEEDKLLRTPAGTPDR